MDKKSQKAPQRSVKMPAMLGFLSAILVILYPLPLLKLAILRWAAGIPCELQWHNITPGIVLPADITGSLYKVTALVAVPYLLVVGCIELLTWMIQKYDRQPLRSYFLFFQFTFTTFLLFSLLLFIVSLVFGLSVNEDWSMLYTFVTGGLIHRALLSFFLTFIIFGYIGFVLARLKNHFSNP